MTAQPLRAAAIPSVRRIPCPSECERGYHPVDASPFATGREAAGYRVACDTCAGHGYVTLHLGWHDGQLHGYVEETQTLAIFEDEAAAMGLQWMHSWKADPRRWRDDEILEALGVEL